MRKQTSQGRSGYPLVLVCQSTLQKAWREKLNGIYRYARDAKWHIQVIESSHHSLPLADLLEFWRPNGVIMDAWRAIPDSLKIVFRRLPVVFLDRNPQKVPFKNPVCVVHDSAATSRLAADFFLRQGVSCCAYVGAAEPVYWSEERKRAFREHVEKGGKTCYVYESEGSGESVDEYNRLVKWLTRLPKPCGVFVVNDLRAKDILALCELNGLNVPEDLSVIGVDNDEGICENTKPTLTSILPDFDYAGYLAAKLLDDLLTPPQKKHAAVIETYRPLRIVQRLSTRRFMTSDWRVAKAVEYIRVSACSGIRVNDVVAVMGCSRRFAERRFREVTSCSILDEIQNVRFERVFELLCQSNVPIGSIAQFSGFESDNHLKNLFKKKLGKTMRAWRNENLQVRKK